MRKTLDFNLETQKKINIFDLNEKILKAIVCLSVLLLIMIVNSNISYADCARCSVSEHVACTGTKRYKSNNRNTHTPKCCCGMYSFPSENHNFGSWSSKDDSNHVRKCSALGCVGTQIDPHNFGDWENVDATTKKRKCNTCNYTQTQTKAENPITVTTPQNYTKTFSTSAQTQAITGAANAQGAVTYSIQSQKNNVGNAVNYFSVNSSTGAITISGSTPVAGSTYVLVIRASAAGQGDYMPGSKDITVNIAINSAKVDLPTAISGLIYNGQVQTGVPGNDAYTIVNNQSKDAGNYTATLTLKNNYQWNNTPDQNTVKNINWSIAKASLTAVPPQNATGIFGDDINNERILPIITGLQNGETYQHSGTLEREPGTNVGSYKILGIGTFRLLDNEPFKTSNYSLNYVDEEAYFRITPLSIEGADVLVIPPVNTYTGEEIKPDVSASLRGITLIKDRDFTIRYANNISVGQASLYLDGIGNYTGTKHVNFTIVPLDISTQEASITPVPDSMIYDGSPKEPDADVRVNGRNLVVGTDFTLSYANNIEVGNNTAVITANGTRNYTGSISTTFSILPAPIDGVVRLSENNYEYNGKPRTPRVESVITSKGVRLEQNIDFTVSYLNNINVGIATVRLTGINHYTGTLDAHFDIYKTTPIITLKNKLAVYTGEKITIDEAKIQKVFVYNGDETNEAAYNSIVYSYYSDSSLETRLLTAPSEVGIYYVQAYLPGDENHNEATSNVARMVIFGAPNAPTIQGNDGFRNIPDGKTVNEGIYIKIYGSQVDIAKEVLVRYKYSFDNITWLTYTEVLRYTSQGTITVYAKAYLPDNPVIESEVVSYTVTIDKTPPTLGDVEIPEKTDTVVIEAKVSGDEIADLYITEDATKTPTKEDNWLSLGEIGSENRGSTIFELSQGDEVKTLYIWQRDFAGNISGPLIKQVFLNALKIGNVNENKTYIYFKVTDKYLHTVDIKIEKMKLLVNGFDTNGVVTELVETGIITDGKSYRAQIENVNSDGNLSFFVDKLDIFDKAGNNIFETSQKVETNEITVDNTLPDVRYEINEDQLTVFASDEHLKAIMLNGEILSRISGQVETKLKPGKNILTVIDEYGNEVEEELFYNYVEYLSSIANPPELYDNMQAMYLDGSTWQTSNYFTESMYDYDMQDWANAITSDGSMWVWIPRFAYKKIYYTDSNMGTVSENPTDYFRYSIIYLTNRSNEFTDHNGNLHHLLDDYKVADAFTMEGGANYELTGIWLAKYEMSKEISLDGTTWSPAEESLGGGNTLTRNAGNIEENSRVVSKPGRTPWTGITVSNAFDNSYYMHEDKTSHLMKSSEYEAALILATSDLGNPEYEMAYDTEELTGGENSTSTTGNPTGIFDMLGGVYEYTSTYINGSDLTTYGRSLIESSDVGIKQAIDAGDIQDINLSSSETEIFNNTMLENPYLTSKVIYRGGDYSSKDNAVESIPVGGSVDERVGYRVVLTQDKSPASDNSNAEDNTTFEGITITLHPNGGNGQDRKVKIRDTNTYILPSSTFYTWEDHKLVGWSQNASAIYISDYYMTDESITVTTDIDLYAVWKLSSAEYLPGQEFNERIKKLTGQIDATHSTTNTSVKKFEFQTTKPSKEILASAYNVGMSGKAEIYAWFENGTVKLWSVADNIKMNADASSMFENFEGLTSLNPNVDLNINESTSNVTNMSNMFNACSALTSLVVNGLDTSNVTDMSYMFGNCSMLSSVDVSTFNTGNVTDMCYMFVGCSNLVSLNLRSFDTSKVTNMSSMFYSNVNLTSLDVTSFNTSRVTSMPGMFYQCEKLTSLNISNFDTSSVVSMSRMFEECRMLKALDISNFNTVNVADMSQMFRSCTLLKQLDISSFDSHNLRSTKEMFRDCAKLERIYASTSFEAPNTAASEFMFTNCTNIVGGNGTVFNASKTDGEYAWIDGREDRPGYFWCHDEYVITFNANGGLLGNVPQTLNKNYGTDVTIPTDIPTNGVKTFKGWASTQNATITEYQPGDTYNKNKNETLYAIWEEAVATLTYNANGYGTAPAPVTMTYSEATVAAPALTTTGFTFTSWNTKANGSGTTYLAGAQIKAAYVIPESMTLYAQWTRNTYTVTYDANGGSLGEVPTSQIKTHGESLSITEKIPVREDYEFKGWATSRTATEAEYQPGESYVINESTILYAVWGEIYVNVTFDPYGGTVSPTSKVVRYNNLYGELPTPTREGYTFEGWAGKNLFNLDKELANNAGNITQRQLSGVDTISWRNNASGTNIVFMKGEFKENTQYRLSARVASSNGRRQLAYIYTDGTLSYVFSQDDTAQANTFYDLSGIPSLEGKTIRYIQGIYHTSETMYLDINSIMVEEGTTSTAYEPYGIRTATTLISTTEDHKLNAIWKPNTYTITYNANGGSLGEVPATQIKIHGENLELTTKVPTRTDYIFKGWATSSSATTAEYQASGTYTANTGTTLYAVWELAEAQYLPGSQFNTKLKALAGNTNATSSTVDTKIKAIEFSATAPSQSVTTSNVGVTTGAPIHAWFEPDTVANDGTGIIKLYSEANTIKMNNDASYMFRDLRSISSLSITEDLGLTEDTSSVTNMSYMFRECGYTSMTSLDLGDKFDTSSVTNMSYMFYNCGYTSMTNLDLGDKFDTSSVTNMISMFDRCGYTSMTSLDLGDKFDTSSVTTMESMFDYCGYTSMTSLDLGDKFDTKNVTSMAAMFQSCGFSGMTELSLGDKFDTSSVTNMSHMFSDCGYRAMTSLDLGDKFDTSIVTNMNAMFSNCGYRAMTSLDLGDKFDTRSVTSMNYMFSHCGHTAMTSLDLGDKFDTSSVTDMSWMFSYCGYTSMTSLDLGDKFDTSSVTNMNQMFSYCGYTSMTSLDLGDKFDTSIVTDMSGMFWYHNKLERIYAGSSFDTSSNPTSTDMFLQNPKLIGGNGTRYDSNNITATYAWIDGTVDPSTGNPRPGYFWCHNEYNVVYNANAGSDTVTNMPTTQTKIYGTDLTLSSNVPVRTNYIFKGWSLASGANNTAQYIAGGTYTQNAGITLYAVWKPNTAQYLPGSEFNAKIKALAGNTNAVWTTENITIKAIKYSATAPATGVITSDVGVTTGAPIYAWFEPDTVANDGTGTIKLYTEASKVRMNDNASSMFANLREISTLNPLNDLGITESISNVTNMVHMFDETGYNANTFELTGLSTWDTSNVTSMYYMFCDTGYNAGTWSIGDLSSWDTSSVTGMQLMFCKAGFSANSFDIGNLNNWDTSNVENMTWMFLEAGYNANTFNIGNIGNWNVSKVTDVSSMFSNAGYKANTFNIGNLNNWSVSNVTSMDRMFYYAGYSASVWNIGQLDSWNTSNVTKMDDMFSYAGYNADTFNLGNLGNWDISSVTTMSRMFGDSGYKASTWNIGNLSSWNTSNVTRMSGMFSRAGYSAPIWSIGDLSEWDTSSLVVAFSMFSHAGYSATTWNIGNLDDWDTSKVVQMEGMFSGAGYNATTWNIGDLSNWNTSKVENMAYMFDNTCHNAITWDIGNIGNWDTSKVTKMYNMFRHAGDSATTWNIGNLSNWNTSNVTTMEGMFDNAGYNATTWNIGNLSNWNTSKVTDMGVMFRQAGFNSSKFDLDLSGWDTSKVTDMANMFYSCRKVEKIFVSSLFVTDQVTDSRNMFTDNTSLIGGMGTAYNDTYPKDKTYARIDGKDGQPGYFWCHNEYDIIYNANAGSDIVTNMPTTQTKLYGTDLTLSSNVPVRTNYIFKGWATSSTATTAEYQAGGTYTANSGTTLYAVWELAEAQYLPGPQFNAKLKALAGSSNPTVSTLDSKIKAIEFSNTAPASEVTKENVGVATGAPIYAWFEADTVANDGTGKIKLYTEATSIKMNDDASSMFEHFRDISSLNLAENLGITENTSNVTNMNSMFDRLGFSATNFNLDLSNLDTSNVTTMTGMFSETGYYATTWNIGDLSNWDTSSVTDMTNMFSKAGSVATTWNIGDLSNWDTSKVTNMTDMFSEAGYYATTWNIGDLSNWNTSNVTSMSGMFYKAGYKSTTWNIGDLSTWDTSNVTTMSIMFCRAGYSATTWNIGDLSNWNTSNVTAISGMFSEAGRNAAIWNIGDLSNWDTSKVYNMSSMFNEAGYKSTTWNIGSLSNWNTSNVTSMSYMFCRAGYNATTLNIGDLSNWNTSKVTRMDGMFDETGYKATTWNIGELTSWDTSNVTNMTNMFYKAGYSATTWNVGDLSSWNTSKVTIMGSMFDGAGDKATTFNLDLTNWDTSQVTDMATMFSGAGRSATTWNIGDLSNWNTSNVTSMYHMFDHAGYNATTWNIGNISNWNTSNVTNMASMFERVGYNATTFNLDLSGWDTSKVTNMSMMFNNCIKLERIYASSSFITTQVTNSANMFTGCSSLVGGMGTRILGNPSDKTYARIDGKDGQPGYFWSHETYNVDYDTNTTDAVTNMPASSIKIYGIELTLSNNIPVRSGYIFKGWSTASGASNTVEYDAGATFTANEVTTLYAVWEVLDVSGITATKYGSGQIRINNLPADVTARIWVPERFVADKQRNPIYCSKYAENRVVDATHNTSQNSVSTGTAMPSTIKDVYMQLLDENGNVISDLYYCDLSSVTTSGFREVTTEDYAGDLYVSNVSLKSRSSDTVVRKTNHANANPVPTLNDRIIDFDLSFKLTQNSSAEYSAKYNVTIVNDTAQDFEFNTPNYAPRVWCNGNSRDVTNMNYISWNITNIYPGDIIRAGESQLAIVEFTFGGDNRPENGAFSNQWTYDIDTTGGMNIIENAIVDTVSRISAVVNESTGDLRGSITRTPFVVEVTNEFEVAKTFELSILENTKFRITNSAGNSPVYTIAGKTAGGDPVVQNYTFYIEEIPNEVFASSPQRITVLFKPTDAENAINVGKVYVQVDVDSALTDMEPPMISDVVIEEIADENVNNHARKVKISWDSLDDSSVEEYTVVLAQQGGATSTYTTTSDPSNGKYDADTYIYIDGLTEDATYTATVYGKDSNQNKPGNELINSATTSQGYACKSESKKVEWEFTVTVSTSNCTSNPSATTQTAYRGHDFVISFTRTSDYTYQNPTVTVNGTKITANVDTNGVNRTVTIRSTNITGPVTITQTAYRNLCLVEGTQILLADGLYKNIEDIEYTDLLKVYNHVTGEMTDVYPIWIENGTKANGYDKVTFSDGSKLKVVGGHYVFSVDENRYVNVTDEKECPVGTKVYKVVDDKLAIVKVDKVEHVEEEVKYYNVVSAVHYNLIANDILTTDPTTSISNVYGFRENAMYSENFEVLSNAQGLPYEYCTEIPYYLYKGLNLRNALVLVGNNLDMDFLVDFVEKHTKDLPERDGKLLFKVTTSLDNSRVEGNHRYMFEEGSVYTLPLDGAKYFVETSTGKVYNLGDKVKVEYSMHFEAK